MKVIDFTTRGNVIKLYLGEDSLTEWWGDDFDDKPFECNAGIVYEQYVSGEIDVLFPFNYIVLIPSDGVQNSPYSKEDMIKRKVPCFIVVPPTEYEYDWQVWRFSDYVGSDNIIKVYFGDSEEKVKKLVKSIGGFYK